MIQSVTALNLPPASVVADVGCGAGAFGLWIEAAGLKYLGFDASAVAIALGREKFPQLALHCKDFVEEPMEPAQAAELRLVTAINSYHCLTEAEHRQRFLANIRHGLQSGTNLLLTTMCGPVEENFRPSKRPRVYLPPETILDEIRGSGFTEILSSDLEATAGRARIPNLTVLARCG